MHPTRFSQAVIKFGIFGSLHLILFFFNFILVFLFIYFFFFLRERERERVEVSSGPGAADSAMDLRDVQIILLVPSSIALLYNSNRCPHLA